MQVFNKVPPYAVGGSCFITKRSTLGEGERCLSLDIDIESLPPFGMLCINEGAVRLMVNTLGLQLLDREATDKGRKDRRRISELRDENKVLRAALASLADAARTIGIEHLLTEPDEELVDA